GEGAGAGFGVSSEGALGGEGWAERLGQRVEGKVWEWVLPSAELNAARQRYLISNTARRSDGVHARVLADAPPNGAQRVTPNLEDAYLYCLSQYRGGATA